MLFTVIYLRLSAAAGFLLRPGPDYDNVVKIIVPLMRLIYGEMRSAKVLEMSPGCIETRSADDEA